MSDPDIDPVELINSRRAGFSKLLGIVVTEATPDCVKATLEVREELCTRPEVLHGGGPSPEVLPAYVAEFPRCGVCNLAVFKTNTKLPCNDIHVYNKSVNIPG